MQIRRDLDWRVELLLCAESLHHIPFDIGPVCEGLERRHVPLHDARCGKRTNELSHLIFRLGFNHEGPGESAEDDASCADLGIFPQTFDGWDDELLELLDRLLAARWSSVPKVMAKRSYGSFYMPRHVYGRPVEK
jgi:hypothetical protein